MKIKFLAVAAVSVVLSACVKEAIQLNNILQDSSVETVDDDSVVQGWIRIKLQPNAKPMTVGVCTRGEYESGSSDIDVLAAQLGVTEVRRVFADGGKFAERRRKAGLHLWYDVRIDDSMPVSRAGAEFMNLPEVQYSEPIAKFRKESYKEISAEYVFQSLPIRQPIAEAYPFNDPRIGNQWHYYNDGTLPGSVKGADINLFASWEKFNNYGSPDVIVGVIDQGVEYNHPDLAANMWINTGEIPGNGEDDDNNGYTDDIYGWNFEKNKGVIDPGGHGTHIAGTIAAVNNNGEGVCGIAGGSGRGDGVRIMSLQLNPGAIDAPFLDCYAYAADMGAVLTSNSWSLVMDEMPKAVGEAIDYFNKYAGTDLNGNQSGPMKGGLCMFAAGNYNNSGAQYVGRAFYPAADSRVIGVSGMACNYKKASYSQYGQGVDIMAPGGDTGEDVGIYSTLIGGSYGYLQGTSMATPHVTGVAALIVSKFGGIGKDFSVDDLKRRLLGSYRDVGEYQDQAWVNSIGVGLLDASRIDVDERNPNKKPEWAETPTLEPVNDGIKFSCKVPADGNNEPAAWLLINTERKDGSGQKSEFRYAFNKAVGESFDLTLVAKGDADYYVEMIIEDMYRNRSAVYSESIKTLPHINRPPVVRNPITNVVISLANQASSRTIDLSDNFRDSDLGQFEDVLTYTITNSTDNKVVETSISGNALTMTPLKSGGTTLTVRGTDTAGAYVEDSFQVSVIHSPIADIEIKGIGSEFAIELPMSDYFYTPESATIEYNIVNANPGVANVIINRSSGMLIVRPLTKGSANISIEVSGTKIIKFVTTFNIKVLGLSGSDIYKLTINPNPANEYIDISVPGEQGDVNIKIYDQASRMVVSTAGVIASNGQAVRQNVAALTPGMYSVVVMCNGHRYAGNFIKR